MKKLYRKALVFGLLLIAAGGYIYVYDPHWGLQGSADRGDQIERGQKTYDKYGCVACHGASGATPQVEGYPYINGQSAAYAIQQIKDIRSGRRDNGMTSLMKASVSELTDQEIEDLAYFLESQ